MQPMNACHACGFPNAPNQRFCSNCGIQLATGCPYCGATTTSRSNFCSYCGNLIAGAGQQYPYQGMPKPFDMRTLLEPRYLVIFLVVILIGIGAFIYFQFFTSPGDITPPVISKIAVNSITKSSAIISWDTNEPSSSQIEYGLSKNYGRFYPTYPKDDPTTGASGGVYQHSVILMQLNSGTTYYYRVVSKDAAGNVGKSTSSGSFKTKTTPPFIVPD